MRALDREKLTVDERLEISVAKVLSHLNRGPINYIQRHHAKIWAMEAAHSVFETHPELREEGSLLRYFVAKEGRKNGLCGEALTKFVENEYQQGTWWKLVPEDVLLGKPKPV